MNTHVVSELAMQRMADGVSAVADRLRQCVEALEQAGVPYAVAGDNATAAWITTVDEAAVRFTPSVHLLVRRGDFEQVQQTMAAAGFHQRPGEAAFVEQPDHRPRNAIRFAFANEKRRPADLCDAPNVTESVPLGPYRTLRLQALTRMELTDGRVNALVNVRDLIDVGLIDATWVPRLPPELASRLQELFDDPDG